MLLALSISLCVNFLLIYFLEKKAPPVYAQKYCGNTQASETLAHYHEVIKAQHKGLQRQSRHIKRLRKKLALPISEANTNV